MKLCLLVFFLLAAPMNLLATDPHLGLYSSFNTGDVTVVSTSMTTTRNPMVTEVSGDATTESAPLNIYIPYDPIVPYTRDKYVALSDSAGMAKIIGGNPDLQLRTTVQVVNPLVTNHYLYAMVKKSSGYNVIKAYGAPFSNETANATLDINYYNDLCVSGDMVHCGTTISSLNSEYEVTLYFFLSTTSTLLGDTTLTPTSAPNGIYYKLKISSKIPSGSDVAFNNLRPGDGRATAIFDGQSVIMGTVYKTLIFKRVNNSVKNIGTLSGINDNRSIVHEFVDPVINGEVSIKDLENSVPIDITVALMNKYQFVSNIPISRSVTPLRIEELLKSQACFLLTAGFGEEHWVIDYFKEIRDHYLAKFSAGRWFIGTYYELAPKYALQIYHSEALRLMIRTMAYLAYSVIHFYYIYMAVLSLGLFTLLRRRSRRT